jgi:uncharacterized protein YjbI with pentapeptide repeats
VREVCLIHKKLTASQSDPDEGWDERDVLYRWVVLCGSTTMDEYLYNFILDEVRLCYQNNAAEVATWQQTFCSLLEFMLHQGMPMERLDPRPSYQEEFRQALNAEDSLLAILGVFQFLTQEISHIAFPSPEAFGALLARLLDQRTSNSNPMSFRSLTYLNLSRCILMARDLGAANLRAANLSEANLRAANLRAADLSEADLRAADLSEANLRKANLSEANLRKANLRAANLREADLRKANLSGADLSGADLRKANLSGADLRKANLRAANLREADLSGADLSGADLSGADLSGACLSEACLSEADLTQEQLNSAVFSY